MKRALDTNTEKEGADQSANKRIVTRPIWYLAERMRIECDKGRVRRLGKALHRVVTEATHKDVEGTTTRLWRCVPDAYRIDRDLAEDCHDLKSGTIRAFVDTLSVRHDEVGFAIVSATVDADRIAELLAIGEFDFHAFMFASEHLEIVVLDRDNDECLFRVRHGPARELEVKYEHKSDFDCGITSELLIARVYEETDSSRRERLSAVAREHRDDAMKPEARTWLTYPEIRRSEAPPKLLRAIASAMIRRGFFVMTAEDAGVSVRQLQLPGYLPRDNLYMRVKGVTALLG